MEHRNQRSGMTVVELMIAMVILAMLLGAIGVTVLRGGEAFEQGVAASEVDSQARRALDRITDELAAARVASLAPNPVAPFGSSTLSFDEAAGFAAGVVVPGSTSRIVLQADATDADDGIDNNGNGLIDECEVVLVHDFGLPTETRATIASWVREFAVGELENGADDNGDGLIDERGLSFALTGQTLDIRVTIERLDPEGRPLARTVETSVRLRN